MAKGFWIARVDVDEMETYKKYVAGVEATLAKFGGKFIVRGGTHKVVEGTARSRNIVAEFPSYKEAQRCWNSPEYQALREIRLPVATADIIIIEGYEG